MLLGLGQLCVAAGSRVDHGQDGLKVRKVHALALIMLHVKIQFNVCVSCFYLYYLFILGPKTKPRTSFYWYLIVLQAYQAKKTVKLHTKFVPINRQKNGLCLFLSVPSR